MLATSKSFGARTTREQREACSGPRSSASLTNGENVMNEPKVTVVGEEAALDAHQDTAESDDQERDKKVLTKQLQSVVGNAVSVSGKNKGDEVALDTLHHLNDFQDQKTDRDVIDKGVQGIEGALEDYVRTGRTGGLMDERSASVINIVKYSGNVNGSGFAVNKTGVDIVQLTAGKRDPKIHGQATMDTVKMQNTYATNTKDQGLVTCRTEASGMGLGVLKSTADVPGTERIDHEDKGLQPEGKKSCSCKASREYKPHDNREGNSYKNDGSSCISQCQTTTRDATNDVESYKTLSAQSDSPCSEEGISPLDESKTTCPCYRARNDVKESDGTAFADSSGRNDAAENDGTCGSCSMTSRPSNDMTDKVCAGTNCAECNKVTDTTNNIIHHSDTSHDKGDMTNDLSNDSTSCGGCDRATDMKSDMTSEVMKDVTHTSKMSSYNRCDEVNACQLPSCVGRNR